MSLQRSKISFAAGIRTSSRRSASAVACGVVLDYDGTLCDRRRRFDPLDDGIASDLNALAATGTVIGIATGRGQSASAALQSIFPRDVWPRVLVGYYNGAVIVPLGVAPDPAIECAGIAAEVGAAPAVLVSTSQSRRAELPGQRRWISRWTTRGYCAYGRASACGRETAVLCGLLIALRRRLVDAIPQELCG